MAFKERYFAADSHLVDDNTALYVSQYGTEDAPLGISRPKESPCSSKIPIRLKGGMDMIISAGYHDFLYYEILSHFNWIIGQGMFSTTIGNATCDAYDTWRRNFQDIAFRDRLSVSGLGAGYPGTFYRCMFGESLVCNPNNYYYRNCLLLRGGMLTNGNSINVSHLRCNDNLTSDIGTNSLFEKCTINIQTISNADKYASFDRCLFQIGSQPAKELIGETSDKKREYLIQLIEDNGFTAPLVTDNGITGKLQRWTFFDNSSDGGRVITNSELDRYQRTRKFYMGYSQNTIEKYIISNNDNLENYISDLFAADGLKVEGNSIVVDNIGTGGIRDFHIQSSIIHLGSKVELKEINIIENLMAKYGVMLNSIRALNSKHITSIEPDKVYHVSSTNEQLASIKYNGSTYTSNSSLPTNVFKGVKGITNFELTSGSNVLVREVNDLAAHPSIDIRLVHELPTDKIVQGSLLDKFWYVVYYDDASVANTGYITYKGRKYPCKSSFMVDSDLTFTIPTEFKGKISLRRFCHRDHDANTVNLDSAFWKDKQAPIPVPIVYDDIRAIYGVDGKIELDKDKIPKGSGHPTFYDEANGIAGLPKPAYNLSGVFLQIILKVTTGNEY